MPRISLSPSPLVLAALVAACAGDTAPTEPLDLAPPVPAADVVVTPDGVVLVSDIGLQQPESIAHDPVADRYLVSNLGDPFSAAVDGFISRLHTDGSVETLEWITGLISPTGIMVRDRELYVVDRAALHVYDADTGAPLDVVPFPAGVTFLNDVCGGPDGRLYVTDMGLAPSPDGSAFVPTGTDAIYQIRDGELSVLAAGTALGNPNGCVRLGAGNIAFTRYTAEGGVYRVSRSGKIRPVAAVPSGGGLNDSAVLVGDRWFVSSWGTDPFAPDGDGVWAVGRSGKSADVFLADFMSPGDMGYDAVRRRVLVPSVLGNVLAFVPVD